MTTYSPSMPKAAVSRSHFLAVAAILSGAILGVGYAGSAAADSNGARPPAAIDSPSPAATEDTMARCQQLYGLWSRHNTDGYAKPLDARMALEDCQKGKVSAGVAALKSALERAQIPIPPAEATAQTTPAPAPTLRPRGEKRHQTQ
ncbi:MAG: hypothetical protein U1E60_21440 [Reyranellaceae bacterium]